MITLPAYERFDLSLWGPDWKALQDFHRTHILPKRGLFARLLRRGLIGYDSTTHRHELTDKGKIPFGETDLVTFALIQDDLIAEQHETLVRRLTSKFADDVERSMYLNELRLFRAQLRRVHTAALYFLEIQHNAGTLYKVGVTTRSLDERIVEIQRDLAGRFTEVAVAPLLTLANRGAVELYFKHRYKAHNALIEKRTEYFTFDDKCVVMDDLTRLGDRTLSDFDRALIAGEPDPCEGG